MLKLVTMLAPLVLASRKQEPQRSMGILALAYITLVLGGGMLLIGLHIYMATILSTPAAFAITGAALLVVSGICLIAVYKKPKALKNAVTPTNASNDPLAEFIPNEVLDNPAIVQLLDKLKENPVSSTATAFTIGVMIARSLAKD